MNVVVSRHQPTIPTWAWVSAVLALLLLISVVWWAREVMEPTEGINSKPPIIDPNTLPEPDNHAPLSSVSVPTPTVEVDPPAQRWVNI
jgi:hypothetical protein